MTKNLRSIAQLEGGREKGKSQGNKMKQKKGEVADSVLPVSLMLLWLQTCMR